MRPLGERLPEPIRRRVGIDPRALAALRVALGLLILADLAIRATDLVAFYTDAGVLPRSALAARFPALGGLSLHALSGAAWVQAGLFLVAGAFALALVVGYRTRAVAIVSWILLVSLQLRNPVLLNAGDSLLRRTLFWGLFLPLGARWSLDAVGGDRQNGRVVSAASVAVLVQVVILYSVNAVLKLRSPLWRRGAAIRHVLGLDQLTVGLGDVIADLPIVLEGLTYLWLLLVVAAPLLLVLSGRRRSALVGLFAAMHIGMGLTMRLGLFPLVSVATLLPFLHPGVWDAVEDRLRGPLQRFGVRPWAERVGSATRSARRVPASVRRSVRGAGEGVVAILLVLVLVWNAAALGAVALPSGVTAVVDPDQYRWDMFAPDPRANDGWYVVPGRLASGDRVDAFHGGPVSWDRPPDLAASFPSHRWFVYLLDLLHPRNRGLRGPFADYLCRRWNARHPTELVNLSVYYVEEPVRLAGPEPRRRIRLAAATC